ncbi:MAG: hypothetical protein EOP20_02955 [Hyphomicrobiales bacterium]|nr:MAG: hypothetical protein EOP20_02955 [Hyphomicrobiales bacterium]
MPSYARRSTGTVPQLKTQTLVVVQAFTRSEDGDIVPATEPREMPDAARAIALAKELSLEHAGAIAFSRIVNPDEGEFSDPTVLFSRGALPDLDMPVRQDELDDDNGGDPPDGGGEDDDDDDGSRELKWRGFQLAKAANWQAFHQEFLKLYRRQADRDLLAVFTSIENRRIVLLPPEAAALVAKELPAYPLGPCARPPGSEVSLELGHSLQIDTTWFEVSAEERQRRLDAVSYLLSKWKPRTLITRMSGALRSRRQWQRPRKIRRGLLWSLWLKRPFGTESSHLPGC